jgi:nicotinate-nucleotide--dimethylbenzimidazole phosphoribosyltransferase
MAPVDAGAAAAVRERLSAAPAGLAGLAAWLAAVSGRERPEGRGRVVLAAQDDAHALADAIGDAVVLDGIAPSRDLRTEPALSVGEVAAAVDAGRELAARAAADGLDLLAGVATAPAAVVPATCLAAVLCERDADALSGDEAARAIVRAALARHPDAARGPLHALRRLGGGDLAALCGVALGAGEHGLGFVADGLPALAAAAVAAGIEPGLRPRLLAATAGTAADEALLEHLGLEPLFAAPAPAPAAGAVAALALVSMAARAAAA